jgi:hypothetical protein
MRLVCEWFMTNDEDILWALLAVQQEELCLYYMGHYSHFLTKELFVFALESGSNKFMQDALAMGAFEKNIFKNKKVIGSMLGIFETDGSKTNFILNVLVLTDISQWPYQYIIEIISLFENFIGEEYQDNRLLLSYNPLLSIALTADLLTKIGEARR